MKTAFSFEDGTSEHELRIDLTRQASFGANIADAHSCLIFLPIAGGVKNQSAQIEEALELVAFHSLSNDVIGSARLSCEAGLIGWVAKHKRSIHVSPFDRDSRTLGIYNADQQLKSFIGIPVPLPDGYVSGNKLCGVIACDSKKSFAFSKLQGKLLDDLAKETSGLIKLRSKGAVGTPAESGWQAFLKRVLGLVEQIGRDSLEILRVKPLNFQEIENMVGTGDCLKLFEQVYRLIRQSLPQHFPFLVLPNGDIVIALDTMLASAYENRIRAVCSQARAAERRFEFAFARRSFRSKEYRTATIERLVGDTNSFPTNTSLIQGELYELGR